MTQTSSTPAHAPFKDPTSERINDVFLRNSAYLVLAGIALSTFLMVGMFALAFVVPAIVLIVVSILVGSKSDNLRQGLITGAVAALPFALFFMWVLK